MAQHGEDETEGSEEFVVQHGRAKEAARSSGSSLAKTKMEVVRGL